MTHTPVRNPKVGSGRAQEGGVLATTKQDFNAHHTGGGFAHSGDHILMNDSLAQLSGSLADPTVQGTLEKMADFLECVGQGFITIGDGYGTTCGTEIAIGDPGIPDLESAFTEALSRDRLRNGGIILVKAGEYVVSSTITIPAGISVMGEIAGTRIVGETSELPMFRISTSIDRPDIDVDTLITTEEPLDKTVFFNLTLMDNINGNVASGGPSMQTTSMILCERGSHFSCEQVTFLGRLGTLGVTPIFGRIKTLNVVGYTTGAATQTTLKMQGCTVDGFRNFVDFTPGGSADKLLIDKCRARVFGSENTGDVADREINCFITTGAGDVRITNNFLVSDEATSQVSAILTVVSGTPDIIMIGNQGSLIFDPTTISVNIVDSIIANSAGTTFQSVVSGNSFDNKHIQNQWFITVGDGTNSIGDVTGVDSIEKLTSYTSDSLITNVLVKRGNYNVSTFGSSLNLIGESVISTLPTITFSASPATDAFLGNKLVIFGKIMRNLRLRASGDYYSLVPTGGLNFKTIIDNCHFENITLLVSNFASAFSDALGNNEKASVIISNCSFVQDGTFADNISLMAPIVHNTVIENCIFTGNGYAMAIGEFSGISYNSTFSAGPRNLTLTNVIADLSDGSITASSPVGSANDRYITIQDTGAKVTLDNCNFTVDINMDASLSVVAGGLDTTFTRFVDILAKEITVDNSLVHGPHQTFDDSGDDFALPAIRLTATENIYVDKSRFIGALPMQVTGDPELLQSEFSLRGIGIYNSQFRSPDGATDITMTALDIDYDLQVLWTTYSQIPKIDVINNIFDQRLSASSQPVLHENNSNVYYFGQGIVQIYAGLTDINFSENKVFGNLRPFGAVDGSDPDNPYTTFAGVYIDGYSLDNFSGSIGLAGNVTHIHNNTIKVTNEYDTASSLDVAASLAVVSNTSKITNNYLTLVNLGIANIGALGASSPQNIACSLILFNAPTTGTASADSIVTGNTFSRRDDFGIAFPHKVGTVVVLFGSGSGICVDNSFSDTDVDSIPLSLSLQFYGPQPPLGGSGPWTFERNKNQVVLEEIRSISGRFTISRDPLASFDQNLVMGVDPTTDNRIKAINAVYPAADVGIGYEKGSGTTTYNWRIPLNEFLPSNVEVFAVSIANVANTFNGGGASTASVSLQLIEDVASVSSTVVDMTATAAGFILVPPVPRFIYFTTPNLNLSALLTATISETGSGTESVTFSSLIVFYKY